MGREGGRGGEATTEMGWASRDFVRPPTSLLAFLHAQATLRPQPRGRPGAYFGRADPVGRRPDLRLTLTHACMPASPMVPTAAMIPSPTEPTEEKAVRRMQATRLPSCGCQDQHATPQPGEAGFPILLAAPCPFRFRTALRAMRAMRQPNVAC